MNKTIYSQQSKVFTQTIRDLRNEAGMNQRELAKLLNREHGMIGRIELGERRVDFVECYWLFKALGVDPAKEAQRLMEEIAQLDESS